MTKILMRQYASSPRKHQSDYEIKLQGIAEGASSAPRLATSFPGRNECPGTHCSLIEQEREDRSDRV